MGDLIEDYFDCCEYLIGFAIDVIISNALVYCNCKLELVVGKGLVSVGL